MVEKIFDWDLGDTPKLRLEHTHCGCSPSISNGSTVRRQLNWALTVACSCFGMVTILPLYNLSVGHVMFSVLLLQNAYGNVSADMEHPDW